MAYIETKGLVFDNKIRYPDIGLKRGEVTFISGPSGCGKTTLFRLLNGTANASAGDVLVDGRSISRIEPLALRRRVLLVNQQSYLFIGTIAENFAIYYRYLEENGPKEEVMQACLQSCGLSMPLTTPVQPLSGGEQQRVFNAICLSLKRECYLWDEPTAALDEETAQAFVAVLVEQAKKNYLAMAVITHDDHLLKEYKEQTIILPAIKIL